MRDLSTFRLANRANIDEIVRYGPSQATVRFPVVTATQLLLNLVPDVAVDSLSVRKGDLSLVRFKGLATDPVPMGMYRFLDGTGVGSVDQIELATYLTEEIAVTYSTEDEFEYSMFEILGTGLRFVTEVRAGLESAISVTAVNDSRCRFKVPRSIENTVTIDNTRALVELDNTPVASDMIFDISTRASFATGSKIVVQRFLTILMDPAGGNLLGLIPKGGNISEQFRAILINRLTLSVGITRAKMRRDTPVTSLPSEILARASVEGVRFNPADGSAEASVRLITQDGAAVSAPISLGG